MEIEPRDNPTAPLTDVAYRGPGDEAELPTNRDIARACGCMMCEWFQDEG